MKVDELLGPALDWAVAKCEGKEVRAWAVHRRLGRYHYSNDWAQGGVILEREKIGLDYYPDGSHVDGGAWGAATNEGTIHVLGPTALVAAMRCYVLSKVGSDVEIPEELK